MLVATTTMTSGDWRQDESTGTVDSKNTEQGNGLSGARVHSNTGGGSAVPETQGDCRNTRTAPPDRD